MDLYVNNHMWLVAPILDSTVLGKEIYSLCLEYDSLFLSPHISIKAGTVSVLFTSASPVLK